MKETPKMHANRFSDGWCRDDHIYGFGTKACIRSAGIILGTGVQRRWTVAVNLTYLTLHQWRNDSALAGDVGIAHHRDA